MKDENKKIKGAQYRYMHSGDCYVFATRCNNCRKEVGGWSVKEADEKWENHKCK